MTEMTISSKQPAARHDAYSKPARCPFFSVELPPITRMICRDHRRKRSRTAIPLTRHRVSTG